MRRLASIIAFVIGGAFVSLQVFIGLALMDVVPGIADNVGRLVKFLAWALPFLGAGVWLSPGDGWRELGRTLLVGAGIGILVAIPVYASVNDPQLLTFRSGATNLLLLCAIGAWLDRKPGHFGLI